jgi:hypothetical protein
MNTGRIKRESDFGSVVSNQICLYCCAPIRPECVAELQYGRIDEILATGLHAYLTQFLDRVNNLGGISAANF